MKDKINIEIILQNYISTHAFSYTHTCACNAREGSAKKKKVFEMLKYDNRGTRSMRYIFRICTFLRLMYERISFLCKGRNRPDDLWLREKLSRYARDIPKGSSIRLHQFHQRSDAKFDKEFHKCLTRAVTGKGKGRGSGARARKSIMANICHNRSPLKPPRVSGVSH